MELKINEECLKSMNYQLPNGKIVSIKLDNGEITDIDVLAEKKKLTEDERCRNIINVLRKAREEQRSFSDTGNPIDFVRENPFDVRSAYVEAIDNTKNCSLKDRDAAAVETLKMAFKDCMEQIKSDNERIKSMQAEPKDFTDSGTTGDVISQEETQEKETE